LRVPSSSARPTRRDWVTPPRLRHSGLPAPRSIGLGAPLCAPPLRHMAAGVRQKTLEFHRQERQLRQAHIRRAVRENSRNGFRQLSVYRRASAKQREHAPPFRLRQELVQEIVRSVEGCQKHAVRRRSPLLAHGADQIVGEFGCACRSAHIARERFPFAVNFEQRIFHTFSCCHLVNMPQHHD